MNNQSVGYSVNRLFTGYAFALAVSVLNTLNIAGVVAGILGIAGLIIVMIALNDLKPYHPGYGRAFTWEIICLISRVAMVALIVVALFIPALTSLVVLAISTSGGILDYLVVHHLSLATSNLLEDSGDLNTATLGTITDKVFLVCCVVSVGCLLLVVFIPFLRFLLRPLEVVSKLAAIAGLALVVYFLYRAKTSLN